MSVEGFDTRKQFAVVAARNEDLCVVAHGGLQEREWSRAEVVSLEYADFVFSQVVARFSLEGSRK